MDAATQYTGNQPSTLNKGEISTFERFHKGLTNASKDSRTSSTSAEFGLSNQPGNIAIYLLRTLRGDTLNQVGREFNMNRYNSVRSVVQRMSAKISNPPASPGISPNGM